mmetsp:Transcript_133356/g.414690  ORF Transcript_133356/g.414690 Transcript_133356/m.414690 type:complete len:308 (+) Transcript_133356:459-1382(+)
MQHLADADARLGPLAGDGAAPQYDAQRHHPQLYAGRPHRVPSRRGRPGAFPRVEDEGHLQHRHLLDAHQGLRQRGRRRARHGRLPRHEGGGRTDEPRRLHRVDRRAGKDRERRAGRHLAALHGGGWLPSQHHHLLQHRQGPLHQGRHGRGHADVPGDAGPRAPRRHGHLQHLARRLRAPLFLRACGQAARGHAAQVPRVCLQFHRLHRREDVGQAPQRRQGVRGSQVQHQGLGQGERGPAGRCLPRGRLHPQPLHRSCGRGLQGDQGLGPLGLPGRQHLRLADLRPRPPRPLRPGGRAHRRGPKLRS